MQGLNRNLLVPYAAFCALLHAGRWIYICTCLAAMLRCIQDNQIDIIRWLHVILITAVLVCSALSAAAAACNRPDPISGTCTTDQRKAISNAIRPLGITVHLTYHALHVWMRQCGAFRRYCTAQVIIWCLHFNFTAAAGVLGFYGARVSKSAFDQCSKQHDSTCPFPVGLLSSCNSATGYTSTLVEDLYWGLFASSSASFITAIFILFFESVFH